MHYEPNKEESSFLEEQARSLLESVHDVLASIPPRIPEPTERKFALLTLDGVFHEENAPYRTAVQRFLHRRIEQAVTEIEQSIVETGARIWKLYNHGFIIRTATVTFGFDLVRGVHMKASGFAVGNEIMARLIDQVDALFISHRHGDHADSWVAQAFTQRGKPVLTPPDLWQEEPFYGAVLHLTREAHRSHSLAVQGGKRELSVVVYPGDHGGDSGPVNNMYLVTTPEGLGFCHTGDQANPTCFAWMDEIRNHHRVDVLMPNCWTTDIVRMLRGIEPHLVITGHENELDHTIDHREPYWLSYERKVGSDRWGGTQGVGYPHPLLMMTWGESYRYHPELLQDQRVEL